MKKTAIVTGSSRGIGFAIARQLGLDGYNIVMVATGPQEKNQAAVDALQKQGVCCAYVQANIGDHDDRLRILDAALTAFGRVDALVNNAGVAPVYARTCWKCRRRALIMFWASTPRGTCS